MADDDKSRPAAPDASTEDRSKPSTAELPKQIGGYSIKRLLGAGGMGKVYLAQQQSPRRVVALKVMKKGLASKSALRRFEYESQILARLKHPNIAQVYEAGTHDDGEGGVPFFAMEYIANAKSIIDYATSKILGTRQRLALFAKVCDAVHHGHQKGIIHRDLKPGNILVDSGGVPKIIDFGVARATDSDLAITTLQTDIGQLIGTLQYMSPEQCEGDPHDLDTRSDVYALGIVLYELLTDRLPYDLSSITVYEAARVIREEKPARPSTINKTLRGDVETIVLKAIEKDRERRYATSAELGRDIQRYLKDEPIEARPPSLSYQFRMFARRNRVLVGGLTAVFLVLILGVIGTSWGLTRALAATQEANAQEAEAKAQKAIAENERDEAHRQEAIAAAINEFLITDLLGAANILNNPDPNITVREVLDASSEEIEGKFGDEPIVEAAVRMTLGHSYRSLDEFDTAERHLERARMLRLKHLGEEHTDTLGSANALAILYWNQGRYTRCEELLEETLATCRRVLGEDHSLSLNTSGQLALVYRSQGRVQEAVALFQELLEDQRRVLGDDNRATFTTINNLGELLSDQGLLDESELLLVEALAAKRRVLGDRNPSTLITITNLAMVHSKQGRHDEAQVLAIEAYDTSRDVYGEGDSQTIGPTYTLGAVYQAQGLLDNAAPYYVEALSLVLRDLGDEHIGVAKYMNDLAGIYQQQGKLDQAEPLFRESLAIYERMLGERHRSTLMVMANVGLLCMMTGRFEEAESMYQRELDIRRAIFGERDPATLTAMVNVCWSFNARGDYASAEPFCREALEGRVEVLGDDHEDSTQVMNWLAKIYSDLDRHEDAAVTVSLWLNTKGEQLGVLHTSTISMKYTLASEYLKLGRFDEGHAILQTVLEDAVKSDSIATDGWMYGIFTCEYGASLMHLKRFTESEAALLEGFPLIENGLGSDHNFTQQGVQHLANLYDAWHEAEPNAGYDNKAAEWRAKLPPPDKEEVTSPETERESDAANDN